MEARMRYESWLQDPLIDKETRNELRELAHNQAEIEDRFFKWLGFGTGGLRGRVGAGSNRMNIYTVRLVTQALANHLKAQGKTGGVAIAHDSRHMSREFTEAAASVLVANQIAVYLFPAVAPTPLLSYAVRNYRASAGIVITASHNPPEYNGYKAYNEHGNQMLTEEALSISTEMANLGLDNVLVDDKAQENPLCHWIGEDVIESYYARLLEIAPEVDGKENLRVLYTPLHGTGGRFVPEILQMAGFSRVSTVEEQMAPDGSFPTVSYPNPEDPKAFNLAFAQAERDPCDLIIATDPDADRMGVAVHQDGEWILLNGNQVGVLLADFLLSRLEGDQAKRSVVIKTIVTTEMVRPIAKKYGAQVRDTLTGFKYIGTLMDRLPAENREFLFGFEESYGYLAGMAVRDKDAVLASLLIAKVAAFYQGQGITLVDRLEELLAEHGYYLQDLVSYSFATSLEAERSREFITRLEREPIKTIGSEQVVEVLNYGTSTCLDLRTQVETAIALPKEGVLQWITEEGSRVTLRPSGTEPKMKLYLEVLGQDRQQAEEKLLGIKEAFDRLVQSGLEA
ncbi:MAG TPA: phospho-sugar mutase [Limnochordia bacterium]|nr:phospho-sugar mutase [Limnochordia bacterium]